MLTSAFVFIAGCLTIFGPGLSVGHVHSDNPLMLLVSFDGFRWDYLQKFNLTNFNQLKKSGSHADFIYNSFATVTFPNHYTMVTGQYEESHGIVHNEMYDPVLNETFEAFDKPDSHMKWFAQNDKTEPIWIVNQKAGNKRKSAASWVASDVTFNGVSPIDIPFDYSKPYKTLIDEFITMFINPDGPINFGAVYFHEPDATGHKYGPYSKEMENKLYELDKTLGYLIDQLKSHHLFEKMNLIVTSDHGMEEVTKEKTINLDDHIDTSLFNAFGRRSSYNLFLTKKNDLEAVYTRLNSIENLIVYKKADIPDKLRYKKNVRIGDILIIAKLGYEIIPNKNMTIDWSLHRGDHGYLNNQSSMYPIFISHGPAFKNDFKIKSFYNVDIYPLMCLLLKVEPGQNDGQIKRVLDMVVYNEIRMSGFRYVYILILLIPLTMAATSCFFFCFCRGKNTNDSSHYTSITQNELLLNDDSRFELDD